MSKLFEKMMEQRYLLLILIAVGYIGYGVLGLTGAIEKKEEGLPQVLQEASANLDEIRITARLDAEKRVLSVSQTLTLTNRTGEVQNTAVLRTWPNAFQSEETSPCMEEKWFEQYYPDGFSVGALMMNQAMVNGEAVVYRYQDAAKTVLGIPVPGGWQPDATMSLILGYDVQIPRMAYRFGVWDGIWALGNAFAIPAVWENGAYRTDDYAFVGDPFVSDCANYTVDITVPAGCTVAAGGVAQETPNGEWTLWHFEAPAVRDFAMVISDRLAHAQAVAEDVVINAYAVNQGHAREMLGYAQKALECYEQRYGAYPYQSYTLAQVNFPNGGMEYPMLCMIGADSVTTGGRELEYAVAHETAHQWWYAVVGSDGWNQPWQDEALAEFSLLDYAETVYGLPERNDLEQSRMESALRVSIPAGVTPGSPLSAFSSMSEYALVVYHRGGACLCALDRTVPNGLDAFLRDYYKAFSFRRASREDFEAQLALSTGEDLAPLLKDYLDTAILN